ncbi:DUF1129 domain-containing protein [Lacticaseibacillus camelliae]|uniref:Membrane-associated protein n=1 Tax=Lacticaseibacillus camelliae DSM 22697 = JCM 13995 TaxID=1423730 RepID=A0A0R2FKZ6_9LACO|nr:DUF1129 family protein [Lacticaseibacillus camelliae]KRN25847.1 membrane-associated protein [Lacticaseibacillus camelliae DSM 22697 = JCM 13995]
MTEKPVKEAEAVEEVVDVDALLGKLSKKNDEYVFKLRRILTDHQWSEERQKAVLQELLPEIITAQHQGKPATQLYGPVTEKANSLIHRPKKRKKVPFWLNGLDLTFLFSSMFGLVYGVMGYFNRNKPQTASGNGLMSLLLMAAVAGFAFAYYNEWSTKKKTDRRKTWQVMVMMVMVILVGSWAAGAVGMIKSPITSPMQWPVYLVVAVVTYGIHYLLKRRYHLRGLMAQ